MKPLSLIYLYRYNTSIQWLFVFGLVSYFEKKLNIIFFSIIFLVFVIPCIGIAPLQNR